MDVVKGDYRLNSIYTRERDCDQMAMGLPPVTSAVLLINNFGKTWASLRNICDASATLSEIMRKWYVCMYVFLIINIIF
jgi:hypothetical protein